MLPVAAVGWFLASLTLYSYWHTSSICTVGGQNQTACDLWATILRLHVGEMGLVGLEAVLTSGFFWPLQMVVIGNGTFITFLVTALVGAAVATPTSSSEYTTAVVGSLAVACFSNAMMVAMVWEHFHRASYKMLTK